ncbi:hypothetical protein FRC14_007048 [Serendipita sp. 396]|nr:hypothetical protein FRC14_007048 [Serendipita sp. 396]KAG8828743.1 hypothetical protein FRC19_000131 [Serendipita sp. 401]KAG8863382.1 hypothetical protein FRC20_010807 [Serendipita sp. 405]KAG9058806.1 hypothetical protein FS842_000003 [Serendipita sp. 407]
MDTTATKVGGDSMQIDMGPFGINSPAGATGIAANPSSGLIRSRDEISSSGSSDEPPSKKPRLEGSLSTHPGNSSGSSKSIIEKKDPKEARELTVEQQEFSERVLNTVTKLPAALPFLQPVDPIVSKAPDYFDVIKRPMDLGTISKRLKHRKGSKQGQIYSTLQEFVDDVNLVFDNCFRYNGPTHAVSQLAIRVKDEFEKGMRDAPGGSGLIFIPIPSLAPRTPTTSDTARQSPSSASPVLVKKRNFVPPKSFTPSLSLGSRSRRDPLRIAQEKFCKSALDHLYKKEHVTWVRPFLRPVDLDLYPQYRDVVAQPMDLGTVQDKLSHGVYGSAEEFHKDIKLIFSNCYAFNPEWSLVCQYGKDLEKIFDEKWKELPAVVPDNDASPSLRRKRSSAGSSKSLQKVSPKAKGLNSPTKRPAPTTLTENQQLELCDILTTISDARMNRVIALIRKRLPQYRDNEESVSLEFEELPPIVQAEMFDLVKRMSAPRENQRQTHGDSDSGSTSSGASDSDQTFDSDEEMQ